MEEITNEIYDLEDRIESLLKWPDLPLNKMEIADARKRIKVLENELRKVTHVRS